MIYVPVPRSKGVIGCRLSYLFIYGCFFKGQAFELSVFNESLFIKFGSFVAKLIIDFPRLKAVG